MKSFLLVIAAALILSQPALAQSQSETRYVSDRIHVPLRAGQGHQYRIVHRGLPSGTELTLIEAEEEYSLVRTNRGLEGWIENQFLADTPIASMQLLQVRQELEKLREERNELRNALSRAVNAGNTAQSSVSELQEENSALSQELEEIKRVSANAIRLNQDNQTLAETNQRLRDQVDVLNTENNRLRENRENQAFMNGAFAVLIGVIITLVVPRLRPRKRSEWV